MNKKLVIIEWEIHDTRDMSGGYRTGTSKLAIKANNYEKLVNIAINFASNLPDWELKANNIDLESYREGKTCRYHYATKLSKILKIENLK